MLLSHIRKSKTNAGLLAKWERKIFTSQGNLSQTAPPCLSTSWVSCAYFTESPCHVAVQLRQSNTACGNLQMQHGDTKATEVGPICKQGAAC